MMRKLIFLSAVLGLAGTFGCRTPPAARINTPPHGYAPRRHRATAIVDAMILNAAAMEMRLVDTHFKPHSPALNDTGRLALSRIAQCLEADGGAVYYRSRSGAPKLYAARVATIGHYLTSIAGLSEDAVDVVDGYSTLSQMEGSDAVAILNGARKSLAGGGGDGGIGSLVGSGG